MIYSWGAHLLRQPPVRREVHFWCVFPDEVQSPELLNAYKKLLCPAELKKMDETSCEEKRKERLLTRALVRTTLARYTDEAITPESLAFKKNAYGKPSVVWPEHQNVAFPPLGFNLSHTDSLIACAVCTGSELGLDMENKTRSLKRDVIKLAKRWFSMEEVSWLQTFKDSEEQRHHFLQLWTLKESYVKAVGKGIYAEPLNGFSFELNQKDEAGTIKLDASNNKGMEWQFLLFEPTSEHYASICVPGNQEEKWSFKFWKTLPLVDDISIKGSTLACTYSQPAIAFTN